MLKKKTAVLFVEPDGTSSKRMQVPTTIVKHWKKFLYGSIAFLFLAVGSIVYAVRQHTSARYTKVYKEKINKLKSEKRLLELGEFNNELTTQEIKKSFDSMDSTIESINKKMKKRGLQEIQLNRDIGGPLETGEDDIVELSIFYKKQLEDLEKKLDGVPLGRPIPGRITNAYGYRRNPFTNRGREMHKGVDLRGKYGAPVKATANGTVIFSGWQGGYGNVVMIKHRNGYETRYGHLSRRQVKKGEKVKTGEVIGLVGSTGRSTGPHLHYEVVLNKKRLNPTTYFNL